MAVDFFKKSQGANRFFAKASSDLRRFGNKAPKALQSFAKGAASASGQVAKVASQLERAPGPLGAAAKVVHDVADGVHTMAKAGANAHGNASQVTKQLLSGGRKGVNQLANVM
jgi:hypothetical protein